MIRAGVVGAAGYAGIEACRIVLGHPDMELVYAASDSEAGQALSSLYPVLAPYTSLKFSKLDVDAIAGSCDVVFLAVPHTAALAIVPALVEAKVAVFDLSADYRLHDPAVYKQWYKAEHTSPELLPLAPYGLPEIYRSELLALQGADVRLVACPGCYPTATALAAVPALEAGLAAPATVISDCLSGVSGAGRKLVATSSFCSADENLNAYGVTTHRHAPEMAQTLSEAAKADVKVVFTPHLVPVKRGILATVYLQASGNVSGDALQAVYESRYAEEQFVAVLPAGTVPRTSSVQGTCNAQVGVAFDEASGTIVAMSAIDNLGKGAAAQAVQCANIVMGLDEASGLVAMLPQVI